jgi:putative serine protease PepD
MGRALQRMSMFRSPISQVVALAAIALLGGSVALVGASAFGAFEESGGGATTVVKTVAPSSSAAADAESALGVKEIYERSAPGVVQVTTSIGSGQDPALGGSEQQALGSGFVVDEDGHVVTNYHVIEGADAISVSFSNKDTLDATLVGSDPSTDLAVLKVGAGPEALTALPLADSDAVSVGDEVVAIGNPFGLERTATAGIVSALQRSVTAPNGFAIDEVIQTDAPINQGNSGGPLLNMRGEVIGVNSQIETNSGGNVGIGFAVPANTVKTVVSQILETGHVDRAYLGIVARPIEPELSRTVELPVDEGLLIESVTSGSAAEKAGLAAGTEQVVVSGESYRIGGDVIVAAAGTKVASVEELRDVLGKYAPGDEIEIDLYRDGKKISVPVELGRQPSSPQG